MVVSKTVINHSQCIIGLLTYGRVGACRSTFQVRFCLFVIGEGKCTFSCKKGAPVILKSCKNFHCLFKVLLHIETHSVLKWLRLQLTGNSDGKKKESYISDRL